MPFPSALPTLLVADVPLSVAFAAATADAVATIPGLSVPLRPSISLVAINESATSPTFAHAGWKERETHVCRLPIIG